MKYYSSLKKYQLDKLETHKKRIDRVSTIVEHYFGVTHDQLKGKRRNHEFVMARGFVILFMYRYLKHKIETETHIYRILGLYFARDRVTMRHHNVQMEFFISNDIEFKQHHFNLYVKLVSNDLI